tara:strand:- start:106 stop:327 length:222 start_codon:yes stop_codon:yes gene_type:complete
MGIKNLKEILKEIVFEETNNGRCHISQNLFIEFISSGLINKKSYSLNNPLDNGYFHKFEHCLHTFTTYTNIQI